MPHVGDQTVNPHPHFAELRTKLDGREPFVNGGHQILKPQERGWHEVPEWILDNKRVGEVLLRSFPHLNDRRSPKYLLHRTKATLWMRIINLYFRNGIVVLPSKLDTQGL